MKLIMYKKDTLEVLCCYEDLPNAVADNNNVRFKGGVFENIDTPFILIESDVEVSTHVTEEMVSAFSSTMLSSVMQTKIDELSLICEEKITEGFLCEATGYFYRLNDKDQDNFGQRLATILVVGKENYTKPIHWRTGKEGDGTYVLHTVDQFLAVIDSADDHKTNNTMRYSQLKEKVKLCTSADEVSEITWDSVL